MIPRFGLWSMQAVYISQRPFCPVCSGSGGSYMELCWTKWEATREYTSSQLEYVGQNTTHLWALVYCWIISLRKGIPQYTDIMELTATASVRTREHIMLNLNMKDNYLIVCQFPNRINICYQVYEKPSDPVVAFLMDRTSASSCQTHGP